MSKAAGATAYALSLPQYWGLLYATLVAIRFVFVGFDSYIHPDEHFQCLEVLAGRILGYATVPPWEFRDAPARSLVPLYVIYGPILFAIRLMAPAMLPLAIWRTLRLQNALVNWLVTDFCLYSLLPSNLMWAKAVLFTLTSYITLVHQTHLFSNSIETWLVLGCLTIINRFKRNHDSKNRLSACHKDTALLAILLVFGVFNRVTFPVFLAWPSLYVLRHLLAHKRLIFTFVTVGAFSAATMICLDLSAYQGELSFTKLVVAPLNNLWYNSSYDNLAQHGIHSRYTHFLVNLPQILGPAGISFLVWGPRIKDRLTLPLLSALSLVLVLSFIPHQEMRFLMPTVPLWCCCFETNGPSRRKFRGYSMTTILLFAWLFFNLIMAVFTGAIHQAGIVPALNHLRLQEFSGPTVLVWWRTYSPPTYFLGALELDALTVLKDGDDILPIPWNNTKDMHIVDAMGSDKIMKVMEDAQSLIPHAAIYLICPLASFDTEMDPSMFELVWSTAFHMDMDHLDFSDTRSLRPGLGIQKWTPRSQSVTGASSIL